MAPWKRSAAVRIEVVYALADAQDIALVELPEGAVARQAVAASGMLARHGLAAAQLQLGIFARVPPKALQDGIARNPGADGDGPTTRGGDATETRV